MPHGNICTINVIGNLWKQIGWIASMEPKSYNLTPMSIALRMIPSFSPETQSNKFIAEGAYSTTMNIKEIESGARETDKILREHKYRYKRGDRKALLELININPAFMLDDWVAEEVHKILSSRSPSRGKGRPFGTGFLHPLIIFGLVDWLIKTGKAKNKEKAFWELYAQGFCTYDTEKKIYYETQRNKYIQRLVFEKRGEQRKISQSEFETLIKFAIKPPSD